jgi:hypothetical protein
MPVMVFQSLSYVPLTFHVPAQLMTLQDLDGQEFDPDGDDLV